MKHIQQVLEHVSEFVQNTQTNNPSANTDTNINSLLIT